MSRRKMFVYLYRLNGSPEYVGQAVHVDRRDLEHVKDGWTPFEKFIQRTGRENFTLEIVGSCLDIPRGQRINALENAMMDKFQTFYPETNRGWNFIRAGQFGDLSLPLYEAWYAASVAAQNRPEVRAHNSRVQKIVLNKPDVVARRSRAQKIAQNRPDVILRREEGQRRAFRSVVRNPATIRSSENRLRYKRGQCRYCVRRRQRGRKECAPCLKYYLAASRAYLARLRAARRNATRGE